MKIQLDTTNKITRLEESIKLDTLFEELNKLLPDDMWKSFTLDISTSVNYPSSPIPIIIREPYNPYPQPWITYTDSSSDIDKFHLTEGIFNVDIQKL